MLRDMAILRLLDTLGYVRRSYKALLNGNVDEAKRLLDLSAVMERRAKRHWLRATRRVKDE